MPDLQRLRERSDDTAGRKLGLFALAGTLSVAAIISAGLLSGGTRELEPPQPDPLAQLALSGADPKAPEAARKAEPTAIELDRLSFPATLVGDDSTVEATLRAAAGEQARMAAPRTRADDTPAGSLAANQAARLQRTAKLDPLIAQAMSERNGVSAPVGSDGAFTLQVISYDSRDQAERFAAALRSRGHRAYVTQAELPDRGRSFRVRVGPFTTRRDALTYQQSFEQNERLHAILVSGAGN